MPQIKTKLTPIRFPGGKSNALKFLDKHLPKNFQEYREPFFGGGSVGLYLMQFNKDATYWINDLFYPVYCFWNVLHKHPDELVRTIFQFKRIYVIKDDVVTKGTPSKSAEFGRELHAFCRERITKAINEKDEHLTAAYWYILNKTSYSGMAMIGSYAPLAWDQNFSDTCIRNLPKTSELLNSVELRITNVDYSVLLTESAENDTFIFLDPPYDIKDNLYGDKGNMHRGFDHERFGEDVMKCKHKWMITYNDSPVLIERFKAYQQLPWDLQYTMKSVKRDGQEGSATTGKSGKKGKELLIWNYDI
jgi:DNA adenine methylase